MTGQRHGRPVDLWSAGCLLYSLLTGRAPFPRAGHGTNSGSATGTGGSGFSQNSLQPAAGTAAYEEPAGLCAAGRDFLRRLLEPDPLKRPTARAMLAHPFLTGEAQVGVAGAAAWGFGGVGMENEEEDEQGQQHDRTHNYSHSRSRSQLLNDSSMLTVVPSAGSGGRGHSHHGHGTSQHWSSSASVATVAPSLPAPPPAPAAPARRRKQQPAQQLKSQKQHPQQAAAAEVAEAPAVDDLFSLSLEIPSPADSAAAAAATTPPGPHHRLHPRRSRRARAKAAAELEAARERQEASAAAAVAAPFSALPFLMPLQALQPSSAAATAAGQSKTNGGTAATAGPPLVPIDASRLRPARFLLPHPSGQHEGLLRLKRDGAVSLKMRAAASNAWRWSLRVRPGGLRVRVSVALAAGLPAGGRAGGVRNEAEYTLGELPLAYHAAYRYCWRLVQGVRAMTPKVSCWVGAWCGLVCSVFV